MALGGKQLSRWHHGNDEEHLMNNILLDVVRVEARPDFTLFLEFENGEKRVFDMAPLIDKQPFDRLKAPPLFAKAYIDYGTVDWPGEIDIAPETLYDRSVPA